MKNVGYYNGKIGLIEEMTVPFDDRAVYFGDGVYDVVFVKNGKFFALDDHLNRFYRSCKLLEMDFTMPRAELEQLLEDLLKKMDNPSDCVVYWQASRGTAPRTHYYPHGVPVNLLVRITEKKLPDLKKRIRLITVPDTRYSLCHIKTINLIPNVMANQRAEAAGCDEAVFVRDGRITECSHSNIAILKDGIFITAPLDCHVLPGISRMHLIQLCHKLSIPVEERVYTPDELMDADEVLTTSTTTLCRAACEIDGKPVGGRASALVELLQNAYLDWINSN